MFRISIRQFFATQSRRTLTREMIDSIYFSHDTNLAVKSYIDSLKARHELEKASSRDPESINLTQKDTKHLLELISSKTTQTNSQETQKSKEEFPNLSAMEAQKGKKLREVLSTLEVFEFLENSESLTPKEMIQIIHRLKYTQKNVEKCKEAAFKKYQNDAKKIKKVYSKLSIDFEFQSIETPDFLRHPSFWKIIDCVDAWVIHGDFKTFEGALSTYVEIEKAFGPLNLSGRRERCLARAKKEVDNGEFSLDFLVSVLLYFQKVEISLPAIKSYCQRADLNTFGIGQVLKFFRSCAKSKRLLTSNRYALKDFVSRFEPFLMKNSSNIGPEFSYYILSIFLEFRVSSEVLVPFLCYSLAADTKSINDQLISLILSLRKQSRCTLSIAKAYESLARALILELFTRHTFDFPKTKQGHFQLQYISSFLFEHNYEKLAYYEILMSVIYRNYSICGQDPKFFNTILLFIDSGLFSKLHNPILINSLKKQRTKLIELQNYAPKLLTSPVYPKNPLKSIEKNQEEPNESETGNPKLFRKVTVEFMQFKQKDYGNYLSDMSTQLWCYLANSHYLGIDKAIIEREVVRNVIKSLNETIKELEEKAGNQIPFTENNKIERIYQVNELLKIFEFEDGLITRIFELHKRKPSAEIYEKPL